MKKLLTAAFLALMTQESSAQIAMCGDYKNFVAQLEADKYKESSAGKGVSGGGESIIELFIGPQTFTVMITNLESNRSCIIAAGKSWTEAKPKVLGDDL